MKRQLNKFVLFFHGLKSGHLKIHYYHAHDYKIIDTILHGSVTSYSSEICEKHSGLLFTPGSTPDKFQQ